MIPSLGNRIYKLLCEDDDEQIDISKDLLFPLEKAKTAEDIFRAEIKRQECQAKEIKFLLEKKKLPGEKG